MKQRLLKLLYGLGHRFGGWPVRLTAWLVSTGYFVFKRDRVRAGLAVYRGLFPRRSRAYHYYCVWRMFWTFADIHADRFLGGRLRVTGEGGERLDAAIADQGGIMVMSHLGGWEVAARALVGRGRRIMILMGQRGESEVGRDQKRDMADHGMGIVFHRPDVSSPLDILEVVGFLRQGGLVSAAGDVVWAEGVPHLPVRFLGQRVWFPGVPHFLALTTGAPLLTVFTVRLRRGRYHTIVLPPRWVRAASRAERGAVLEASAQQYAADLEAAVGRWPWQWFRFESLLTAPPGAKPHA